MATFDYDLINIITKDDQLENQWILNFSDFEDFDLYVESHNLPLQSLTFEKIPYTDTIIPTGKDDYKTYQVTFRETVDFQSYKYHMNWFNLMYDFKKRLVKKTYHRAKKTATIKFISRYPGGLVLQNASFTLRGMQLVSIDDVQLPTESGNPLMFTANYEIQDIGVNLTRLPLL